MTAKELQVVLQEAIDAGKGDCEVLFDSEAQCFKVHMIHLKSAYFMDERFLGYPFISLHYDWKGQVNPMHGDLNDEEE